MLDFDFDRMLFNIPANEHKPEKITEILREHPEVKFVSLVGIDIGGHDTDEKIPVELFLGDLEKMLTCGVQTDGSSVVLPKIADLNNAKVSLEILYRIAQYNSRPHFIRIIMYQKSSIGSERSVL